MTDSIDGFGISAALPIGWEGRMMRRGPQPGLLRRSAATDVLPDEQTNPVVHLANFALPPERGDYGSGAVDIMGRNHALVVLVEFSGDSHASALFRHRGLPRSIRPGYFSPNALQRRRPGQMGYQRFFNENGRAFCLYIVLGSQRLSNQLCGECTDVVRGIRIGRA